MSRPLERLEADLLAAKDAYRSTGDPKARTRRDALAEKVREARWTARGGPEYERACAEADAAGRVELERLLGRLEDKMPADDVALLREYLGLGEYEEEGE